ncbi:MAG: hypothetical protein QGI83_05345, partial [Candidatus Latescibacteria bacterium]|nr:hypothetical protein [Candidatus Latescibacterota bacterium]
LDPDDVVVVKSASPEHRRFLLESGLRENPENGEWVGEGRHLYGMDPDVFYRRFGSSGGGQPDLTAQATDGTRIYQIDGLPQAGEDETGGAIIVAITALDLETRTFIQEGVANFRAG